MRRSPQAGLDAGGAGPADAPRAADAAAADAAVAAESGPGEGVPVPEPQDADVRPDHMEEAVRAAAQASEEGHLGEPGRPLNRRSPFFIGLAAAAGGTTLLSGIVGAGMIVIGAVGSLLVVVVLTIYFLAGLPRIKLFAYRLAPQSRRARVILLGDEIFTKVGAYVLGNVVTSVIAGIGTFVWMLIFGIPYPVLLGLFVALLDLIPVIGSTIGGIVVTLVALTVSLPVALFTIVFYVGYRLAEDYLLVPRILGRAVQVPAVVSVVAVLIGGALLGIIGALVAIPAAAALRLWLHEVAFRRLDSS
jgi:predicted PurR-regulated permease PerM